jgi:hypothetical protein
MVQHSEVAVGEVAAGRGVALLSVAPSVKWARARCKCAWLKMRTQSKHSVRTVRTPLEKSSSQVKSAVQHGFEIIAA